MFFWCFYSTILIFSLYLHAYPLIMLDCSIKATFCSYNAELAYKTSLIFYSKRFIFYCFFTISSSNSVFYSSSILFLRANSEIWFWIIWTSLIIFILFYSYNFSFYCCSFIIFYFYCRISVSLRLFWDY